MHWAKNVHDHVLKSSLMGSAGGWISFRCFFETSVFSHIVLPAWPILSPLFPHLVSPSVFLFCQCDRFHFSFLFFSCVKQKPNYIKQNKCRKSTIWGWERNEYVFKPNLKCALFSIPDHPGRLREPSCWKMAIMRQFGLLVWKNSLQQVSWREASVWKQKTKKNTSVYPNQLLTLFVAVICQKWRYLQSRGQRDGPC